MENIRFTHYWVSGFGWENTIFLPEDFETVELLGSNEKDGQIFCGINGNAKHILKGYTE
jgi:hypothetical protein